MAETRPFILITNDDGIHAPGIRHLWEAVREHADVIIVAPHTERSGSGLSITLTQPLHVHPFQWIDETPAWSVSGTPADCVKMALSVLVKRRPDMVISGVNRGSNSGRDVLYSGTVGGVIEAAYNDLPGIAFSFSDFEIPPLSATKPYFFSIISHFLEHPLPKGSFLNVNFPLNSRESIKGFRLGRQGRSRWLESPDKRMHPQGSPYYWLGGKWLTHEEEDPESDVILLAQGYISGAPIHVGELTDRNVLVSHKNRAEEKINASIAQSPQSERSR